MCTILILMSTYNGDKYLEEQLKSILKQETANVSLLIRDDGSIDRTKQILEEYSRSFSNIYWYTGENLGAAKSFIDLIINADKEFDYYAFADQDDYWLPNKIEVAVKQLSEYNNTASLYFCNPLVVDQNLKIIEKSDFCEYNFYSLESALLGVAPLGCTMVFNKKLLNLLKLHKPNELRMHDHWVLITCFAFKGKVIADKGKYIMYRQHAENVVGGDTALRKRIKNYYVSFSQGKCERYLQANEFYNCYNTLLDNDIKLSILKLLNYKKSTKDKLNLLKDKKYRTHSYKDKLFYLSILLNKF